MPSMRHVKIILNCESCKATPVESTNKNMALRMKSATLALCSAEWNQCASLLEGFRFMSLANQSGIVTQSKTAFSVAKLFTFAVPPETPLTRQEKV